MDPIELKTITFNEVKQCTCKIIVNSAIHALKADKLQQKDSTITYVNTERLNIGGKGSFGDEIKTDMSNICYFMFYVLCFFITVKNISFNIFALFTEILDRYINFTNCQYYFMIYFLFFRRQFLHLLFFVCSFCFCALNCSYLF